MSRKDLKKQKARAQYEREVIAMGGKIEGAEQKTDTIDPGILFYFTSFYPTFSSVFMIQ